MLSIKSKIVIVTFVSVLKINALYAGKIKINDVNKLSQSDKVRASQLYKEYDQLKGNDSKRTQIIKQMMKHPLTDSGLKSFMDDWQKTGQSIE